MTPGRTHPTTHASATPWQAFWPELTVERGDDELPPVLKERARGYGSPAAGAGT